MYHKLFSTLDQLVTLTSTQQAEIRQIMKPLELHKDSVLLEQGEVCGYLYFLSEGVVRQIYHQEDREITSWFAFEGEFVNSFFSFVSRRPSLESIVLVSDCKLLILSYEGLQYLYQKDLIWNKVGRLVMERYFIELEERLFAMQLHSAAERYDKLLQKHPYILSKVKLGHLASYLGVTQETLSRIRAKWEKRQRIHKTIDKLD